MATPDTPTRDQWQTVPPSAKEAGDRASAGFPTRAGPANTGPVIAPYQWDLLAGLLALSRRQVDVTGLVHALRHWSAAGKQPLLHLLRDSGILTDVQIQQLGKAVDEHLGQHQHDLNRAVAALSLTAEDRTVLASLGNPHVQEVLSSSATPPEPPADPYGTRASPAPPRPASTLAEAAGSGPTSPSSPPSRFPTRGVIGRGGIGQVLLAMDQELQREVALKEIQAAFADVPQYRQRFLQEAEITGRLEHPGVVPVYGLGRYADGRPYYAMRFIRGQSLRQALKEFHDPKTGPTDPGQRTLRLRQLLTRFVAVCNTIAYAHSKGVLHRDLKPDNIMLGPYGETLVVDWGLAKVIGQTAAAVPEGPGSAVLEPSTTAVETAAGSLVGTPAFMSPEQAAGKTEAAGPASDVYSLGTTLYNLLTGKAPFGGTSLAVLLESVRNGDFLPPRQADPRVPVALDAVVRKAMALRPEDRYASAKELGEDVERYLADEPVRARPESLGQKLSRLMRRYRGVTRVIAGSLVILTLFALGALLMINSAQAQKEREHAQKERVLQAQILEYRVQDTLREGDWERPLVENLKDLVGQLRALNPEAGERARKQIEDRFVQVIGEGIGRGPNAAQVAHLREQIAWLADLSADAAQKAHGLDKLLTDSLGEWRPRFTLTAPSFKDLATVFPAGRVKVEEGQLHALPPDPPSGPPIVRTLIGEKGSVQLEATFASNWTLVPAVGLLLNVTDGSGYRFLVTVPEFVVGQDEDRLADLKPLGGALRDGVKVRLVRNNVVLREVLTPLPAGELKLTASREGERLTFQVMVLRDKEPPYKLDALVFEDFFPLRPDQAGVFGLFWPKEVGLVRLVGLTQLQAPRASPLEQGDKLFNQGDYAGALDWYREQAGKTGDRSVGQQARFKQGLALYELGRKPEARDIWNKLLDEMPAAGAAATAKWSLRAAAQLWVDLLREGEIQKADAFLDRLPTTVGFEKLAPLLPAELRLEILDRVRVRGHRGRNVFIPEENLKQLEKARRVEEIINESPYERRTTRWLLIDVYRILGDHGTARIEMNKLLNEEGVPLAEQVGYLRDSVWMHIERHELDQASKEVEEMLRGFPTADQVIPLLLERARVHVAQQKWDEAEQDVAEFFRRAGPKQEPKVDYADWADGCLLQGLLLERKGEKGKAQEAWKKGLLDGWPGGLPVPPRGRLLSGVAANNRANSTTFLAMLSALSGELNDTQANFLFNNLTTGNGEYGRIGRVLAKKAFTTRFIRDVIEEAYTSPRGRDLVRRMAYRQIPLYEYLLEPLVQHVAAGLRLGAYPSELPGEMALSVASALGQASRPPTSWLVGWTAERALQADELEAIINKGAWDLFRYYRQRKIDDDISEQILTIWRGQIDPGPTWKEVAPKLEPDLRIPAAAALGSHLYREGKGAWARPFLQEVVDAKPKNILYRLAAEELQTLPRQ